MAHPQNIRATDSTGTAEFEFVGTGLKVRNGGIDLAGGTPAANTISNASFVSSTFNAPVFAGAATDLGATGLVFSKTVSFTEANNGAAGAYVGSVVIPAGATILNIQIVTTVLWNDGTSAVLKVGDSFDDDGWFIGVDVKATDLLVGEVLDISNAENWGGKQGAYLVAATGRKGSVQTGQAGVYYGVADIVKGTITAGAGTGSAGRTFMTVTYSVGTVTDATFTAS